MGQAPSLPLPHTCKLLSTIQLVSKSSSSSPNGLMSCSATLRGGETLEMLRENCLQPCFPPTSLGSGRFRTPPAPRRPFLPGPCLQSHHERATATYACGCPYALPSLGGAFLTLPSHSLLEYSDLPLSVSFNSVTSPPLSPLAVSYLELHNSIHLFSYSFMVSNIPLLFIF